MFNLSRKLNAETPSGEPRAEGKTGEDRALTYLQRQGLTLIERNFRCRSGEIDLVMQDGKEVVFVEVRKRKTKQYGGAAASVNVAKQKRLILAASVFLQSCRSLPACRFDVVAIEPDGLSWLKNAFDA